MLIGVSKVSFDGQHIKDQVGGESIRADLVGVEFGYGGLGFIDLTHEPASKITPSEVTMVHVKNQLTAKSAKK